MGLANILLKTPHNILKARYHTLLEVQVILLRLQVTPKPLKPMWVGANMEGQLRQQQVQCCQLYLFESLMSMFTLIIAIQNLGSYFQDWLEPFWVPRRQVRVAKSKLV